MADGPGNGGSASGSVSGVPRRALFLPGISGDGREFWQPVADELAQDWDKRFLSWPGFGPNAAAPDVNSYDDLANMVRAQLVPGTVLVAQSMGCLVALRVVLGGAAEVHRLVLAAGPPALVGLGRPPQPGGVASAAPQPTVGWAWTRPEDLSQRLRGLTLLTLLVWGTRDAISPLEVGQRFATLLPHATLLTFDTDDHWVARVHAREVAGAITGLVADA